MKYETAYMLAALIRDCARWSAEEVKWADETNRARADAAEANLRDAFRVIDVEELDRKEWPALFKDNPK